MVRTFRKDLERELRDPEFASGFGVARAKSSFAITLALARAKAGLTQKELADKVGVSQAYIAKLEGGEANPTLERIGSLLAALGLSLVTNVTKMASQSDASVRRIQGLKIGILGKRRSTSSSTRSNIAISRGLKNAFSKKVTI